MFIRVMQGDVPVPAVVSLVLDRHRCRLIPEN